MNMWREQLIAEMPCFETALNKRYEGFPENVNVIRRQVMLFSAFEAFRTIHKDCPETLDDVALRLWFDQHPDLPAEVRANLEGIHENTLGQISTIDPTLAEALHELVAASIRHGVSAAQRDMIMKLDAGLNPNFIIEAFLKLLSDYASSEFPGSGNWLEKI